MISREKLLKYLEFSFSILFAICAVPAAIASYYGANHIDPVSLTLWITAEALAIPYYYLTKQYWVLMNCTMNAICVSIIIFMQYIVN